MVPVHSIHLRYFLSSGTIVDNELLSNPDKMDPHGWPSEPNPYNGLFYPHFLPIPFSQSLLVHRSL